MELPKITPLQTEDMLFQKDPAEAARGLHPSWKYACIR